MNYQAIVFDMDGVLIDSERIIRAGWIDAACEFGYTLPDELFERLIGAGHQDSGQMIRDILGAEFPMQEVFLRAREMIDEATSDGWPEKTGATEFLEMLASRRVPIGVASSTRRKAVHERLTSAGLLRFIDELCCGDEVTLGKPNPEIYRTAASRMGIPADCCIAVEDSMHGIRSAAAAGMYTVLVPDTVEPPSPRPAEVHSQFESLEASRSHLFELLGHEH